MNNDFLKYASVIQEVNELINIHFREIVAVLFDKEFKNIFYQYNQNREENKNSDFNIFNLVSDKYYYENFHSDIISTFLDTNGEHKEGNKFLKIFIELIQILEPELEIDLEDFNNTTTARENYRIDILIQDENTQKAIIIENKINNATDTYRQLPTYVNKIGKENVAAIIYLPLAPSKRPDKTDWTDDEISFVNSKLVCLPAFNRTENDFFNGWLQKCIRVSGNDDSKTILKQYSKLIQKIGGFIMDKNLYTKFYDKVIAEKDVFYSALSIKEFIDNLPNYRAEKLKDYFMKNYSPFQKLVHSGNVVTFEGYENAGRTFRIHLNCLIDKYELKFWDENINGEQVNIKYTKKIIATLKAVKFEEQRVDEFVKWFSFPDEEQNLYEYIHELKEALKSIPKLA